MKIISGYLGGREIRAVPGKGMRPAMARARESLFSSLEARGVIWQNARVLDLFAGSGCLALECLSRGAAEAVFVEKSREICAGIRANARRLQVEDKCRVVNMDVIRFLRGDPGGKYDVIFVDPPYRQDLADRTLELISPSMLGSRAFVAAELEKDLIPDPPAYLTEAASRFFGQTRMFIWEYDEDSALSGNL